MRVNTDKYIVCRECGNAEHYSDVTAAYVRKQARQGGWKGSDNREDPICPDCVESRKEETNGTLNHHCANP